MILLTGAESMDRMFGLDWQLIADSCLTMIAVLFLFLALSYLLFNPARKMLNDRKMKIQGELTDAREQLEQANALKAEYDEKLREIEKEADQILGEARRKALANENQIVAQAREEASRIIERAHVEAELEKQKLADEVKTEMITIASVLAGKVVAASIDTTVQNQLVEETLKEMGKQTWLS